jgi:hypothetical protein
VIRSNLDSVIGKFKKAQRELPDRIDAVMDDRKYLLVMKDVAHFALERSGLFDEDERAQIPLLVERITSSSGDNKMQFVLEAKSASDFLFPEFDAVGNPIWDAGAPEPPKEVVDWVSEYKEKDPERDAYKKGRRKGEWYTDERIAKRVMAAIERDPTPWFRTDEPGHGALNPQGLAAIVGLTGLPAEKVSKALLIVLYEWKKALSEELPHTIAAQIRSAFE